MNAADAVQAHWDMRLALGQPSDDLPTQAQVLEWLPEWMRADFDCARGPHEWLSTRTIDGVTHHYCRHCPRKKRTVEWPSTHHLYGIYGV